MEIADGVLRADVFGPQTIEKKSKENPHERLPILCDATLVHTTQLAILQLRN